MGLLTNLFKPKSPPVEPNIQFGRFTDATKSQDKYLAWDKAIGDFESEKYLQSYTYFFEYLYNESHRNLSYKLIHGVLHFSILQGSIIIEGVADYKKFFAKANIVKTKPNNLPLMRYLLELNYDLKYTKYALDSDLNVVLIFDTLVEDSSPHKLYQALKELAMEADRKDDLFLNKFGNLDSIPRTHTPPLSQGEMYAKYQFVQQEINKTLHQIDNSKLAPQEYPGAITYLILDLVYRIDFLVKPEGIIKERLMYCHELYFDDTTTPVHDKNRLMVERLQQILAISYEELVHQLYTVNSTFGTSKPEGNNMVMSIIEAQQKDLSWYGCHHPDPYARAICGYIIGHCLYAYALPEPTKALLIFFYRVQYDTFYGELGFEPRLGISRSVTEIKSKLSLMVKTWQESTYPDLKVDLKALKYENDLSFAQSYIYMLTTLQYTPY
jgi:hypothetical protein